MIEMKLVFDRQEKDQMEDAMREVVDELMEEICGEILKEAKYNLLENDGIVTGKLEQSGYVRRIRENEWELGFSAPHAGWYEFGTNQRAKLPPVDKLIQWARMKFGLTYDEAKRVGWAVAKWIKEHGTKPHPFFRPAIFKVAEKFKNLVIER